MDSKEFKSMRADVFVLCSSYFILQQLSELSRKLPILPILRANTELMQCLNSEGTNKLLLFNGSCSTKTPDSLPLVGSFSGLTNLFFFTGF